MSNKNIKEGDLAKMAHRAEQDHEVQMARSDLYKLAKYSIKLHDMLKNVTEEEGIEGWQQAKITKAADYLSSVYHSLDYDMKFGENVKSAVAEAKSYKKKQKQESVDYKNSLKEKYYKKLGKE
jgi:hypothetical protein